MITTKIKIEKETSKGLKVNKRLKQERCLSSTLFKIYLDRVLRTWERKCRNMGVPLNNITLYSLCFTDDHIVLARDYDDFDKETNQRILQVGTRKQI